MAGGKLLIGTSGWVYKEWAAKFYPKEVKQRDWLPYFAEHYPCVEVNSTFYRLPMAKTVRRWAQITPPSFKFIFKIWRMVSHYKKLHEVKQPLEDFIALVKPVQKHAGPLLLQLPPGLKVNADLLADFLHLYKKASGNWPLAVEFRHASWYCDEVTALLDKHKAGRVVHDMPASSCAQPNPKAPFVYMRYHGAGEKYGGSYTRPHLKKSAGNIRRWLTQGRDVFVFFNNDKGGHALENANTLLEEVKKAA